MSTVSFLLQVSRNCKAHYPHMPLDLPCMVWISLGYRPNPQTITYFDVWLLGVAKYVCIADIDQLFIIVGVICWEIWNERCNVFFKTMMQYVRTFIHFFLAYTISNNRIQFFINCLFIFTTCYLSSNY